MHIKRIVFILMFLIVSACEMDGQGPYKVIYEIPPDATSAHNLAIQKNYTIGIVPKVEEIPYFNLAEDGAMEAAEDLGVNVIFEGPPVADAEQQIKVIEQFIEQNVDVIAVSANDPVKLTNVLSVAMEKGIRVITWDSDTVRESRELFINMVDPETLGRHLLDTLAWTMGEKGEYVIMTGSSDAPNAKLWIEWIQKQQQQFYPEMSLLDILATDDDPQKAYEVAKLFISEHPDLKGILGVSSVGPPAAAQILKEEGLQGRIKVVGLSTPSLMREYLQDGSAQMATLWSPKKLGYLTVVLAKALIEGKLPADGQEIPNVGNIIVNGDVVIMGEPLDFTSENVGQYDF